MPVLSTTSVEKDENGLVRSETFATERGFELTITSTAGGLYTIVPKAGGNPPKICDSLYTSYMRARDAVIAYVKESDRNGYADYPGKPRDQVKVGAAKRKTLSGSSQTE